MPLWLSLTWRDRSLYTKGPSILPTKSKNELIWHCHIVHFEQNQAETKFVLSLFWQTSSKQLTKVNFLREFVLAPKHLWATIGPWRLRNRWVCSGAPPSLTCDFPPPRVCFLFNKGQAGEQHLQVTGNINTLCRIAELPQIYLHLYDRSRRDFKDSEKAFNY